MTGDLVVVYRDSGGPDAINAYSLRLTDALTARGANARYVGTGMPKVPGAAHGGSWILLQYQPFSFGRWGVAPALLRDALALRKHGIHLGVMVHEAWVQAKDMRSFLMASYQELQLRTLVQLATVIWTSTDALAAQIGRDARPLPVGSDVSRHHPPVAKLACG